MKPYIKLIVTLIFLSTVVNTSPGQNVQGKVTYTLTHNWVKKMAAVNYLSKERREREAYMFGNRAEWTTKAVLLFSSSASRYEDMEEPKEERGGFSWRPDEFIICRNFSHFQIFDVIQMLGKIYIINDSLHFPKWKILNDIKEIAGHICMNACMYDSIKSQYIEAWFALDLPVQAGPERFCGLPGLILEININYGALIITAQSVDIMPSVEIHTPAKTKGKKITEQEYLLILKNHYAQRRKEEAPPFFGVRY